MLWLRLLLVSLLNAVTAFTSIKRQRLSVFIHQFHDDRIAKVGIRVKPNVHSTTLLRAALPRISVSQVQSNVDILSLADLRYKEWILEDDINNKSKASPSQNSFRLATAEICQERSMHGAIAFLANYHHGDEYEIVGAAELSPIETRGCIHSNNVHLESNVPIAMYATDVVTSSSHRRLGIGSKLMNELENTAWRLGCRFVFLHVECDNDAAIDFYHGLGYLNVEHDSLDGTGVVLLRFTEKGLVVVPTMSLNTTGDENVDAVLDEQVSGYATIIIVDAQQLAANAGTSGQLLMVKKLQESANDDQDGIRPEGSTSKAAAGFGYNEGGFGIKRKTAKKRKK
jgi:ribosomal protein S18 acetylase RimI-like enzyme